MTIEHFSLMRGGPTFRLVRGLARLLPGANLPAVLSVLLVTATFVPLLVLCGRDGTLLAGTVAMPLLGDWFVMFRFLLALPLLVLAAAGADAMLRTAIGQLFRSGLVADRDRPRFGAVLDSAGAPAMRSSPSWPAWAWPSCPCWRGRWRRN